MVGLTRVIFFLIAILVFSSPVLAGNSPFTGLALREEENKYPVMAIIDNLASGETQSGLQKASIVYEFPVEGGITRLLALYYDEIPARFGPIRSARPYMIEKAREYNAILLHAGASPEGYETLAGTNIDNLDKFFDSQYFYRDDNLSPPHNLYSGRPYLQEIFAGISPPSPSSRFPFTSISITAHDEPDVEDITIRFSGDNIVEYRYLPWEGYYQRYVNGAPHLLDDGSPIKVDNLVIQRVRTQVLDNAGRLAVDLEGSGPLKVFQDGQLTQGTWLKVGPGWTSFLDERGRLIGFNAGTTWVEIVPRGQEVSY